jgi:hypothetical protein
MIEAEQAGRGSTPDSAFVVLINAVNAVCGGFRKAESLQGEKRLPSK